MSRDTDEIRAATVVVTGALPGGLAQEVRAGRHTLIADEPTGIGDDLGPTPYDLLLAALGTCTAMTLRLYAQRKGWMLTNVSVELSHDRVYADDSRECETAPRRIERIERIVSLDGQLDEAQRDRLLEIAEMCPVHRTLMGNTKIVTRLSGAGPLETVRATSAPSTG
jgi:putative redox protein